MCGIYGTVNRSIALEEVIPLLKHRGPDAQTTWSEENIQLHHFRLSIVDREGGFQPMHRGDLVTIFNGEIYNHIKVRQQLELNCKSNSDTETLLAAFEKIGEKCLDYFDGMFALAIFNKKTKRLFLARDRAGKKPVYIYKEGKCVVFASELRALKYTLPLRADEHNIDQFLKGALTGHKTSYQNVKELLGGQFAWVDSNGGIQINTWWNIRDFYNNSLEIGYCEAKVQVENHIHSAVERRVESSDLEVGAFLSGGIDSGLVVASASRIYNKLKTFTVTIPGAYNEAYLANLVAQRFGTDHTEISIEFDSLKQDFETIVGNYGEPFFDSSAIPSYYVSKEAKKHLTVILNGDGADELFAGYRRYVVASKIDLYRNSRSGLWSLLKRIIPHSNEKKSSYNHLYRLISTLCADSKSERYWSLTLDVFSHYESAFVCDTRNDDYIEEILSQISSLSGLQKQMAIDFDILLQGALLKKMDIATMAHSLEGRSPMLSKELLEFAPRIPDAYKIKGTTTKYILRDIAKDWLPIEIFNQPKRGFEIPLKKWINEELNEIVFDYLNVPTAYVHRFVHKSFMDRLLEEKVGVPAEKRAKMIYQLLIVEIWAHKYGYV